jgi:hypothetical protein
MGWIILPEAAMGEEKENVDGVWVCEFESVGFVGL